MSKVEITSHKEELMRALETQIKTALTMCGLQAVRYAQDSCPVDTGRLRGSIAQEVVEHDLYIGTNVEYAAYVELGTGSYYPGGSGIVGMAARPYLKPALDQHRDEYQQIITDTLKS